MKLSTCLTLIIGFLTGSALPCRAAFNLRQLKVPPGYQISIFAENVQNARSLARGAKGTIFVGTRSAGKVYALVDKNRRGKATHVYTLAEGLNMPNGVAFRNGSLYVSEVNRILRFDQIETHLSNPIPPVVVYNKLPTDVHHGWKFIAFGPDGYLYVPVGAPCNICERANPWYASLLRFKVGKNSLSEPEIFAEGIRNTVGFAWHPNTKELWFTDNGRDWLGDDLPPDELNRAPRKGLHFGFPYCHGGTIPDPEFGGKRSCDEFEKPALNLGPHVAALGMRFWNGVILIAEHGSWNRSTPIGYRVTSVTVENNQAKNYQVFADGWLKGSKVSGRPVDLLPLDNANLLVSDDHGNRIFRIHRKRQPLRGNLRNNDLPS